MTLASSGASTKPRAADAAREALRAARSALRGTPRLGFVFSSAKHDLAVVLQTVRGEAPECEFIGCHTAGEFTEQGALSGGLVVFLLSSDTLRFRAASASGVRTNVEAVAEALTRGFSGLVRQAAEENLGLSTTVLLVDGLAGAGERLVKEVLSRTRLFQQIVGGAAGDDGAFQATQVGGPEACGVDVAAAVHLFDTRVWGVGVDHGLRPTTPTMTVTRAVGTTVFELDGRPAFEVYQAHAKARGVALDAADASHFLVSNELGVFFLNELHHARAPIRVASGGALQMVSEVPQGAQVCILDGEPSQMVTAARRAAQQARDNLGGAAPAGVMVFDCVCRGLMLGDGFGREIDAITEVFPGVPVAGFLTYGEMARFRGRLEGWHNATAVVVAIPQ